ncbi:MAG TPA: cyanophycin synthetase, partial [Chitinophagales bacterium]|nr:cyanophycin synthetase [Chitinophagales bacterium]
VYGVATLLGEDSFEILRVLSTLTGAQGRFEWIKSKNEGVIGIVDYAHTPDALKNVLDTVNDVKMGTERLITIFGCGGDRDHGKRPKMGHIAAESSDIIIITSDNPRSEEPMSIIQEIKQGVPIHLQKNTFVQVDRKEAIRMAVSLTQKNDIIMIAGKGHEEYQEIKGEKHPFNDKAILQETFKEMNK